MTDYKTAVHGPVTVHEGDWYARRFPSGWWVVIQAGNDYELTDAGAAVYVINRPKY